MTLADDAVNSCPWSRHGNRLDVADHQWHLHSPTPYDPPLTYSGWNQARAVGQKIASVLRDKEQRDEAAAAAEGAPRRRRRYKIVIHSSPFLRCVQTSIGISAGLASSPEPTRPTHSRTSSTLPDSNPRLLPPINTENTKPPQSKYPSSNSLSYPPGYIQKTVLRLDAFLGEWLTPGYFEHITPPPGSSLMLASAKAELLRKEDYGNFHIYHSTHNPHGGLGHGLGTGHMWGQSPVNAQPQGGFENLGSLAGALRHAGRSNSVVSNGESHLLSGGAYVSPSPSYAVSHNDGIPEGYVAHARDNCCDIDYQWDSTRGYLDWGDGGSLGEEWTAMHQRFRKGLQRLVDWYSTADQPTEMVTKECKNSVSSWDECAIEDEDDEDDIETESVVILVSHGAGCNALIGAITHKPVLTDVGLASLTQAVRKPGKDEQIGVEEGIGLSNPAAANIIRPHACPGLIAIHQYYDLKLFASTEHLTATRSARAGSIGQNRARPSGDFSSYHHNNSHANDFATRRLSATANLGSMRRTSAVASKLGAAEIGLDTSASGLNNGSGITVGSGVTRFLQRTPTTSSAAGGLWSPLRNTLDTPDEDDDNFLPNFNSFDMGTAPAAAAGPTTPAAGGRGTGTGTKTTETIHEVPHEEEEHNQVPELPIPQRGSGTGGLWGSPKPLAKQGPEREFTVSKRRWTVTERSEF